MEAMTWGTKKMRREQVQVRRAAPRERAGMQVLPLDPRDPLICRAKEIRRSKIAAERT